MKNIKRFNLFNSIIVCGLCALLLVLSCGIFCNEPNERVHAETIYCDDVYTGESYDGDGTTSDASYDVYYDSYEITAKTAHSSVPSFGNTDATKTNYCAPLAAMNVVGFYDRWCENLIPNYTPGVLFASGKYKYYPDMSKTETKDAFSELYSLMKTGEVGGTTSANFKSGLNTYVQNAGYTLSYSSFYSSGTTVNLQRLTSAIDQGKVGIVMCSKYNYVLSITDIESESHIKVAKNNSDMGHMMMVYGYKTYAYYKNGVNFQTDTFLYVCSSYGSGSTGFMLLNDYSEIDEALIMTIS